MGKKRESEKDTSERVEDEGRTGERWERGGWVVGG